MEDRLMSTTYCLLSEVSAQDLFDGRLEKHGVREHINHDETTGKSRCLTDGRNYLWVYIDDDGHVGTLSRYGGNVSCKILNVIAEVFDADIASEYEPQFSGFDTQEEWDAWEEQMSREADESFYAELLKYLRGEPCDIRPGSVGMGWAQTAKMMVEQDPSLLLPGNKGRFMKELEARKREQHVTVELSSEDMAMLEMLGTHEDDLPRA
jgi:hypothetical protein